MRIYFDTCSLQRPLDDRSQPRINVEAEAVLTILRFVASGDLELLSSEVLEFEVAKIPDIGRQTSTHELLELASEVLPLVDEIETQAAAFAKAGLRPVDALHLATAFWNKADFFLHV
jgi:predicted nucleic acid-binding protein